MTKVTNLVKFEDFSISQLPELKGKKDEIKKVINENPIIEITCTASYEQMKKSRTAVRTLRTGLEAEQKDVKRKIKEYILDPVDQEYSNIVLDVKNEETLRQSKVTAYEEKKEQERKEKAEKEENRKTAIRKILDDYTSEWKTAFNLMVFETIEEVGAGFLESYTNFDLTVLEEFESLFPERVQELTDYFDEKSSSLKQKEADRIEKERVAAEAKRLAEEKEAFEAQQKAAAEAEAKAKAEREQFEKEKAEFELKQRYEKRKQTLVELGFVENEDYFIFGEIFNIDKREVYNYSDDFFDRLLNDAKISIAEASKPQPIIETPVEEQNASELIQAIAIDTIPVVDAETIPEPIKATASVCNRVSASTTAETPIEEKQITWNDIIEEFKASGEKSYSKWLVDNYNVPTKKQV